MAEVEDESRGRCPHDHAQPSGRLNAFNTAMHQALAAALKKREVPTFARSSSPAPGAASASARTLTEFKEAAGDIGARLHETYHPNVLAIRALEKPVIAAVNGHAAAQGCRSHVHAILRIAADSASFVPAFINIGLVRIRAAHISSRHPRAGAGVRKACVCRKLTAAEAHAWGLVSEVAKQTRSRPAPQRSRPSSPRCRRAPSDDEAPRRPRGQRDLERQLEREADLQTAATETEDFKGRRRRVPREAATEFRGR